MNRKGFTLIELLATLVILGIVVGITVASINGIFGNTKKNTEDVFVKTLKDALDIYLTSDALQLSYSSMEVCTINKRHGNSKIYRSTNELKFKDIIDSKYSPLVMSDVVNPANEKVKCNLDATVSIYRDSDYVYYYKVDKSELDCLINSGAITNLPSDCVE